MSSLEQPLKPLHPSLELAVLALEPLCVRVQVGVRLPPVDPHLLGAVHRTDEQPQLDRQKLDVEQVDLDVAGDHDSLVEHPLEDVREVGRAAAPLAEVTAAIAAR